MIDQEYTYLSNKIFALTNLDIRCYKSQQMRRRLEAYILKKGNLSVPSFCSILEQSREKQSELLDYLAINVSEFFRDTNQYNTLQTQILPQLLSACRSLNIWSAACSCGQEPYSIAMVLEEINPGHNHRILATDIDQSALAQANSGGPYSSFDIRNIPRGVVPKYLLKNESGFWVCDRIKKKVTFRRHNLLSDPFEGNFDLIVCRNVIIYFSDIVRNEMFKKFHSSLKKGGVLFLGGSEVVLRPTEQGFSMINPAFYRKLTSGEPISKSAQHLSEVLG